MNLQGIVAVSGKPGLWRALAQNKTGYILESLDAAKTKLVANLSTAKIAALHEITIFGEDDDLRLIDIFERMKTASGIPDAKADGKKLREFFREVAPDHDEEKVYASDMKKVITWYQLLKDFPFFTEETPVAPVDEENAVEETPAVEAPVADVITEEPVAATKAPAAEVAAVPATEKEVAAETEEQEAAAPKPKPKAKKAPAKKAE